jgi:hypothetical protein
MIRLRVLAIRPLIALAIFLGFGGAPSQALAQKACSMDMYQRAESSLVDVRGSWPSLLDHQRAFDSCDDGALAEGYSDAVVTLLAQRWDQFSVFIVLSKEHPAFRRWVIRHIDATASDEDLKKVMLHAATCVDDVKTKRLCKAVRQAAAHALGEWNQLLQERERPQGSSNDRIHPKRTCVLNHPHPRTRPDPAPAP